MDLLKIALIVIFTICISLLLRSVKSEFAVFPIILLTIFLCAFSVQKFSYVFDELIALVPKNDTRLGFTYLLKVTGICLVTDFVSNICEDTGNSALSGAIDFFGRLSMIICILPLIREVATI